MIRRIIKINKDLRNERGACTAACHEGVIGIVDRKARLLKDDYRDGLGDCLPTCPIGTITFEEWEAAAYDEAAVKARVAQGRNASDAAPCLSTNVPSNASLSAVFLFETLYHNGCLGSRSRSITREARGNIISIESLSPEKIVPMESRLS